MKASFDWTNTFSERGEPLNAIYPSRWLFCKKSINFVEPFLAEKKTIVLRPKYVIALLFEKKCRRTHLFHVWKRMAEPFGNGITDLVVLTFFVSLLLILYCFV